MASDFLTNKFVSEGLTYDDVLLVPGYSEVLPRDVSTASFFTRKIKLNAPIVSAAMDTVTEHRLAIAIAKRCSVTVSIAAETMGAFNLIFRVKKDAVLTSRGKTSE